MVRVRGHSAALPTNPESLKKGGGRHGEITKEKKKREDMVREC